MKPKISIVVPYHDMDNAAFFLKRNIDSIMMQTFKDYEIVLTKDGKMAENTNSGIVRSRGELIKILYLDDYFAHENALKDIVDNFTGQWMITATNDNHNPFYTEDIETGNNRLGSPSALTIKNHSPMLFDEELSWLLDCDYYKRMYIAFGEPQILKVVGRKENVVLGKGPHQMTNILTDEQKREEGHYMISKYYA